MTDKNANKIGYKKTKLGWIPEDWEVVRLKDIVVYSQSGLSRKLSNNDIGLPVIRSNNIKNNTIDFSEIKYWYRNDPQGANTQNYVLQNNDILLNFINSLAQIGKCAIFINSLNRDTIFTTNIMRLKLNPTKITPYFYILQTLNERYLYYIGSIAKPAVNQASFTSNDYKMYKISLPPITEQEKIAEVLSCWDNGIEILEKLLEKKQLHKKALMQRLLSRKLILCCSEKWKHAKFNSLFERIVRKNKELNKNILTISAQQGLISQKNFYNKRIASIDTSKYILLEFGEFAYNKSFSNGYPLGAIKRLELYQKGVVSSLYICFKLKDKNGCSDYWKYYFEAGMLNKEIKMIAQEGARNHGLLNMTTEDFFNILLYYPEDKNEQQKIAEVLNNCDEEIRLLDKKLAALKQQKKGLMQKLLSGEIRVKA